MAVYKVSQITSYLKDSFDRDYILRELWISGEVSNLSPSAAGHRYFTLKDSTGQLRCVMFKGGHNGEALANGEAVVVHGRVSFYEIRGDLQFYVDIVQPDGLGDLALELERLKALLDKEGLFDSSRKRALPSFPRAVGVVTSATGAVFHDICNIIERRYPLTQVILSPSRVQGSGAAKEIVSALDDLNEVGGVEVIIVARGGGSMEELWPFNEESVVRAIYASRVPVISGVGHDTDYTIADLVADCRAPTPSTAAELAVPSVIMLLEQVQAFQSSCIRFLSFLLSNHQQRVEHEQARLDRTTPPVGDYRQRVDELAQESINGLQRYSALLGERIQSLALRLGALDPFAVLNRGFAIVEHSPTGVVVRQKKQIAAGVAIGITVGDGSFGAVVT
jgi:exodeoxyribonuclease VII large subunit